MPKIVAPVPFTDPVRFTPSGAALGRGGNPPAKFTLPFVLTGPVRITADSPQPLRLALPATPFHALTLTLQVFLIESPTTVSIAIETAMQNEDENGWQTVDTFTAVTTSPSTTSKVFTGLLRYVRYRVTLNGSTAISFAIQGVAYGSRSDDVQRLIESTLTTKQCAGDRGKSGSSCGGCAEHPVLAGTGASSPPLSTAKIRLPFLAGLCAEIESQAYKICDMARQCFDDTYGRPGPSIDDCYMIQDVCDKYRDAAAACWSLVFGMQLPGPYVRPASTSSDPASPSRPASPWHHLGVDDQNRPQDLDEDGEPFPVGGH